jgi:vacuolar protein-sorting-associated protein 4
MEREETEDMEITGSTLRKAIELVTKASEADKIGNYPEALKLYQEGVDHYLQYDAQDMKTAEIIQVKCLAYLERMEVIKKFLGKLIDVIWLSLNYRGTAKNS